MLNHILKLTQSLNTRLITVKTIGILTLFLHFSASAIAQPIPNNKKVCTSNLPTEIENIINKGEHKKALWGILVKNSTTEKTLYELNKNKYFVPASNVKLLTTAAALLKLGKDFQIETPVYITGNAPNLTTLRIVGKGDPSLTTEDLKKLAQKLKKMGVRTIGKVIVEDGYLPSPESNLTWEWSDLYYYYAVPVNSLILNENTVDLSLLPQQKGMPLLVKWSDTIAAKQWLVNNKALTGEENIDYDVSINLSFQKPLVEFTGELATNSEPDVWSLSILNPSEYFLDSLNSVLDQEKIFISNSLLVNSSQTNINFIQSDQLDEEKLFLTFQSPKLSELVKEINQNSNNLYAEVLFKYLIKIINNDSNLEDLENIFQELGLEKNNYNLKDGSGLSKQNLVTPEVLADVLTLMAKTKYSETYRQSLSVAGVNGTLEKRFSNTIVEGNFSGKTGTLTGVSALSGYLKTPNSQPLIVSIVINNNVGKSSTLREVMDEIVVLLTQLNEC